MPSGRARGFLLALLLCGAAIAQNGDVRPPVDFEDDLTCQPIVMELCRSVGYANASFPNYRGHLTQGEAFAELDDFAALFQSGCSGAAVHFFCAYYFPLCTFTPPDNQLLVLPPCRGFCLNIRERCELVLTDRGLSWPGFLDCTLFPEVAANGLCLTPPDPSVVTLPPIVFSLEAIVPTLVARESTATQMSPTSTTQTLLSPTTQMLPIPMMTPSPLTPMSSSAQLPTATPPPACQRLDTKYCPSAIGYVNTRFPNSRGQQTQTQAEREIARYDTAIRTECAGAVAHFLCSYFFPECVTTAPYILDPCRELCVHVRTGCQATFQQMNLTWPAEFACELFPPRTGGLCSGPANPAAVNVPAIPGVTSPADGSAASAISLTLTTILLACLAAVL